MDEFTPENDINKVLKALNHEIRRKIIRTLYRKQEPIAYSEFLEELNVPASSNAAYHLLLLTKFGILQKGSSGYKLTEIGERVALLLDIVVEPKSSAFTSLYMGFSRLSPLEILLGSWWIFFLLLGVTAIIQNFLIGVISLSFSLLSVGVLIYKTRTPWAILLINNFLWILFAPEYRSYLFLITFSNLLALFLLLPELGIIQSITFPLVAIGLLLLVVSISLSSMYIYKTKKDMVI
ncbi:MAG: ArsR/SmtB family transcription factor [Candidatus Hodarchaeales archaeon]|jgi:hypothetical protein